MPPDSTTRAECAARVIAEMCAAGLQGDITHDEIAGTRVHAERGPYDLEHAYRHFTGPGVRPDNDEMLERVVRFYVRPPAIPLSWDEAWTRVLPTIIQLPMHVATAQHSKARIQVREERPPKTRSGALQEAHESQD